MATVHRARVGAATVALLLLGTMGACARPASDPPDAVRTWDLRTAPTAQDVGLRDGRSEVSYDSDDLQRARVLLPQGMEVALDSSLVLIDAGPAMRRMLPGEPAPDPQTFSMRTRTLDLDDGLATFDRVLTDLRLPTGAVDELRAAARRDLDGAASQVLVREGASRELGYLTVGVQARLRPSEQRVVVEVGASWGGPPATSTTLDRLGRVRP